MVKSYKSGLLPDVGLLISEDSQQEPGIDVGHGGLWDHHVIPGGEGEERHHLASHRVVGHIQGTLELIVIILIINMFKERH